MFSEIDESASATSNWTYEMGWRYVKYSDPRGALLFSIEPMITGADIVNVPNRAAWENHAPAWATHSSKVIIEKLKSVKWHRNLSWVEGQANSFLEDNQPVRGSLEDTAGGRTLEGYRLFHPGSNATHEQAHEIWLMGVRRYAEATTGRVPIFSNPNNVDPASVFGAVELPTLLANSGVTIEWKNGPVPSNAT